MEVTGVVKVILSTYSTHDYRINAPKHNLYTQTLNQTIQDYVYFICLSC